MKPIRTTLIIMVLLSAAVCADGRPLFDAPCIGVEVGRVPYLQAAGDLDGDGLDDLVVADADGASVLLTNPDSTFRRGPRLALDRVSQMKIGSVTSDTFEDLIILPRDSPVVRVYPGRGDGSFDGPLEFPFQHGGNTVLAADLNGDGRTDLAIPVNGTLWILEVKPESLFAAPRPIALGLNANSVLAGDVDGNGKLDVVVVDAAAGKIGLLLDSMLDGNSLPRTSFAPGASGISAMGDFNGDGFTDLAVTIRGSYGTTQGIQEWPARGDGTWLPPHPITSGLVYVNALVAIDLDGDGFDDLTGVSSRSLLVYRGTDTGLAETYKVSSARASSPPVVAGRFDGDRYPDLCTLQPTPTGGVPECGNLDDGTFAFIWHGAAGGFASARTLATDGPVGEVVVDDFDRDGLLDVVATGQTNTGIWGFRGSPGGIFFPGPVSETSTSYWALADADVDGDGKPELIAPVFNGNAASQVRIFDVAADGSLTVRQSIPVPGTAWSVVARDWNGDGHVDLALAEAYANLVQFLWNDGSGRFVDETRLAMPITPLSMRASDLDRDGRLDLVTAGGLRYFEGSVRTYLGDGAGAFALRDTLATERGMRALAVSEHSGADPLLFAGENDFHCPAAAGGGYVLRSVDGALARLSSIPSNTASSTWSELADVDGDGRDDLLTIDAYGLLKVRPGLPDAEFGEPTAYAAPDGGYQFHLEDFDRDGRADVFIAGRTGVHILRNVGAPVVTWADLGSRIGGGVPEAILAPGRSRAVSLVIAGDHEHDARMIVPESVRLAGAQALRGRATLQDGVRRVRPVEDACDPLADGNDGFPDLTVRFESRDVLAGLVTTERRSAGADLVSLPWSARRTDGSVIEGTACALVVEGVVATAPEFAAYGSDTRTDLGVGVTLDLPAPSTDSAIELFDVAGRRVAILHRGALSAGFHRFPWLNAAGHPGIYFALARIDEASLRTRVLVLR